MPAFNITNMFQTPRSEIWDMSGTTYSFEQKLSRGWQRLTTSLAGGGPWVW